MHRRTKYLEKRAQVKDFTVPLGNRSYISKENKFLGKLPTRLIVIVCKLKILRALKQEFVPNF